MPETAVDFLTIPHDQHLCRSDDHCCIHNVDEPITETTYQVCGECFHAFQSLDELLGKHLEVVDPTGAHAFARLGTPIEPIYTCPECGHDF